MGREITGVWYILMTVDGNIDIRNSYLQSPLGGEVIGLSNITKEKYAKLPAP